MVLKFGSKILLNLLSLQFLKHKTEKPLLETDEKLWAILLGLSLTIWALHSQRTALILSALWSF